MDTLVAEKISKVFSKGFFNEKTFSVLRDLSFHVKVGEGLWVRGKNGSGKTTLLRTLAMLSLPTAGKVFFAGTDLAVEPNIVQQHFAYVPAEQLGFFGRVRNRDNLKMFCTLNEEEFNPHEKETADMIAALGLVPFLDTPFERSSSGIRKKCLLLSALLKRPKVLLIDEIFSNIDAESRKQMNLLLEKQMAKHPMVMVWVAHENQHAFGFPCKELHL